ncbi:MAG: NAD(P)H-hydrate dehydratase [Lachnospiraceae bacterium]|nr:NAD(P)H-hydrate dehydratase [Lachnospiraceae bacterium]
MKQIVSTKIMRSSDAAAIAGGTDSKTLMWRAGEGVLQQVEATLAEGWHGKVAIVCGTGNNAGDGYVLALLLRQRGVLCELYLLQEKFSEDGAYYFAQCKELGIPYKVAEYMMTESEGEATDWIKTFSAYDMIVDCLFGTGFHGEATGMAAEWIIGINEAFKTTVISVDANSGMNGDNGLAAGPAVHSALTVSIGTYKLGHFLNQAKDYRKQIVNCDIGIPIQGKRYQLLEKTDMAVLFPERKQLCNKGDFGYVTIMGGSLPYSGAAKLANMAAAAMRAGCGVVKLAVPRCITGAVAPYLLESTLYSMPDTPDGFMAFEQSAVDEVLNRVKAAAIGMGWGRCSSHADILEYILNNKSLPLILDADALNTLSEMDLKILKDTRCQVVLTPHPKEFERLSGKTIQEVKQNPVEAAENFATEYGVILLLKGATTIVTDGTETYLTDRGCAGMATAGSGDVLTGILAGMAGYLEVTPLMVAGAAFLNGYAGELAEAEKGSISMVAGDTVEKLPQAIMELENS